MSKYSLVRNQDPRNSEQPHQHTEYESSPSSKTLDILVGILILVMFTLLFTIADIAACLVATPVLMNINGVTVNSITYPMVITYLYTTDQTLFYEILVIMGIGELWWGFNKLEYVWT